MHRQELMQNKQCSQASWKKLCLPGTILKSPECQRERTMDALVQVVPGEQGSVAAAYVLEMGQRDASEAEAEKRKRHEGNRFPSISRARRHGFRGPYVLQGNFLRQRGRLGGWRDVCQRGLFVLRRGAAF
mmetsp:Transcript_69258/g.148232  ORF Transcript_69258/g.148232 Transcript_69258/m.148232 type:complete len:130 (+) Transcript_69258:273-662(+)